MENNILKTLTEVLEKDKNFVSSDRILLKNIIRQKAENLDENLISLLLDNETLREKFFIKVKDFIVFDNNKFIKFINNKEFLPDSYTSFKNKIGLTNERWDFIASSNEVVLNFPFKDCVLAWWQDKEDQKRDEIFYNEILGQDDIDRLFDKKVFTNFKRIDKDWEHKLEEFNRDENWDIKDNLIIKWNNLLALHSLKSNFAGKVKLIYIDPPYNTWSDSFNYNDKFNHSTWLTFMKNRLEVAKDLLRDDWVIFVQCDDNEQAYLKVLMDEIFWRENFIANLIWEKKNWRQNDAKYYSTNHEFIINYWKNKIYYVPNLLERTEDMLSWYKNPDNDERGLWTSITLQAKSWTQNNVFEIEFPNWVKWIPPKGTFSRFNKDKLLELYKDNRLYFWENWNNVPRLKKFLTDVKEWVVSNTILFNSDVSNTQKAKSELKELFWENVFDTPKPEKLLEYLINLSTSKWDIVLDYHLWSSTTCAVAHKMGRQYIWIEQMDYIETISVKRMKKVIEWEQWWISKNVEWKWWWDFVYMEIMQENEKFINSLNYAKNITDLLKIYNQIKDTEFINYKVDTWNLKLDNLQEKDFKDFKCLLIEILDKNLVYKNYSEIEDKNSLVTKEDKIINNLYYKY